MLTLQTFKTRNNITTNTDDNLIQSIIDGFNDDIIALLGVPVPTVEKTGVKYRFSKGWTKTVHIQAWNDIVVKTGEYGSDVLTEYTENIDYVLEQIPNTTSFYQISFISDCFNANSFVELSGNFGLSSLPSGLLNILDNAVLMGLSAKKLMLSGLSLGGQSPLISSENSDGLSISRDNTNYKLNMNLLTNGLMSNKDIYNQFMKLAVYTRNLNTTV